MRPSQVIHIQLQAPVKPAEGLPCNGCGVCCLAQPCPLGMVLSGSRSGACRALLWQDGASRYVCGAMDAPYDVVLRRLPREFAWLAKPLAVVLPRLARRWIAAGIGCDSSLQALPLAAMPFSDNPHSPTQPDPPPAPSHD